MKRTAGGRGAAAGCEPVAWSRRRFLGGCALAAGGVAAAGWRSDDPPSGRRIALDYFRRYVEILPRAAWTRSRPEPDRMHRADDFTRITIHHAGTQVNRHTRFAEVAHDIEDILTGHRRRHFGDLGYHFVVDRAGRVWEGRSLYFQGAHVARENHRNIGVMLLGNFERQAPSTEQLAAMERMTAALRRRFGIPAGRIFGHRDLGATLCPGTHLYGDVLALKRGGTTN